MPQTAVFTTGGEVVDPALRLRDRRAGGIQGTVTSAAGWTRAWLTLTSETLELSNVVCPRQANTADIDFTATAADGSEGEPSVVLSIDG